MRHYLQEVAPRTRAVSEVATCSLYWKPPQAPSKATTVLMSSSRLNKVAPDIQGAALGNE